MSPPLYTYTQTYPSGSSAPAYNSRVYNGNQLRWQTVQTRRNLEISRNIVHRLRFKRCLLSYTSNVQGKGRCRTRVGNTIVHLINNTFNVATKLEKSRIWRKNTMRFKMALEKIGTKRILVKVKNFSNDDLLIFSYLTILFLNNCISNNNAQFISI